jgi:GNAT superfamily N-acetyltransferase
MQICRIGPARLREALELVWEVFEIYEAPVYEEMGIKTFRYFIEYDNMVEKVNQGEMIFWGCYLNNYLLGVIALRSGQHISLLFVRDKFHKLGVATKLLRVAVNHVASQNPKVRAVTVNSSPYAVGFYQKAGFAALGTEREENGIRFTSMRLSF